MKGFHCQLRSLCQTNPPPLLLLLPPLPPLARGSPISVLDAPMNMMERHRQPKLGWTLFTSTSLLTKLSTMMTTGRLPTPCPIWRKGPLPHGPRFAANKVLPTSPSGLSLPLKPILKSLWECQHPTRSHELACHYPHHHWRTTPGVH